MIGSNNGETTMKEYVMDKKEFASLTKGRIHWCVEKEPILMSKMDGTGSMQTGELHLILSVSGIAKDGGHVVVMKVNCGTAHRYAEGYNEKLQELREAVKEEFPNATEGAWA